MSAGTDLTIQLQLVKAENEDLKKQNRQLKGEKNLASEKISVELAKLKNKTSETFVLLSSQKDDLDRLLSFVKHEEENNFLMETNVEPEAASTPRKKRKYTDCRHEDTDTVVAGNKTCGVEQTVREFDSKTVLVQQNGEAAESSRNSGQGIRSRNKVDERQRHVQINKEPTEAFNYSKQAIRSSPRNKVARNKTLGRGLTVSEVEEERVMGQPDVEHTESSRHRKQTSRPGNILACSNKLRNNHCCPICSKHFLNLSRHMIRMHKEASVGRQKEDSVSMIDTPDDTVTDRVKFVMSTDLLNATGEAIEDIACAMKQITTVKQLKKSYCKMVGLEERTIKLLIGTNSLGDGLTVKKFAGERVVVGFKRTERRFEGETVVFQVDVDPAESYKHSEQATSGNKVQDSVMVQTNMKASNYTKQENRSSPRNKVACSNELRNNQYCPICSKHFLNLSLHVIRMHKEASVGRQKKASVSVVDTLNYTVTDRVKFVMRTDILNATGEAIEDIECAMKTSTNVKQLKKSYCKKVGLQEGKVELVVGTKTLRGGQTVRKFEGKRVVIGFR